MIRTGDIVKIKRSFFRNAVRDVRGDEINRLKNKLLVVKSLTQSSLNTNKKKQSEYLAGVALKGDPSASTIGLNASWLVFVRRDKPKPAWHPSPRAILTSKEMMTVSQKLDYARKLIRKIPLAEGESIDEILNKNTVALLKERKEKLTELSVE
jgi:hypothetical protein